MFNHNLPLLRGKAKIGGESNLARILFNRVTASSESGCSTGGFPFVRYTFNGAAKEAKWGTETGTRSTSLETREAPSVSSVVEHHEVRPCSSPLHQDTRAG
jgi:hypothetical protein